MGGIIGKLSFEHDETLAQPVLDQMLGALRHRGRIGQGIHIAPGIALGWCGDDPAPITRPAVATNDHETVRVVADATLTNAGPLRTELEQRGHVLRGRTDADLIAHAYDEWGDTCVEHLRGPFACAIWDGAKERLLLARDCMGIRPLFFAMLHGHGLVFASEIRALLQDPGVGREWCPEAIDAYLALGYVPAPLTAYQRISKVEPAQRLVVEGRRLHVDQYWDLPVPDAAADPGDVVEELETRLRAAIRAELKDAGIGGTLYSGGMASTALLAAAAGDAGAAVSVALDEDATEVARAHAAAQALGYEPNIEVAVPDVAVVAPQLAAHFDEPLADPAAVSQYAMLVAGRLYADVMLTGHGAAALWAGRPRHGADRVADALWHGRYRRSIYTRTFAWQVRAANPFGRHVELHAFRDTGDALDQALYVEAHTSLPDNTLAIAERAAIAAGLQLRFPFLERGLVECAARVPASLRRHGAARPNPLHAMVARVLPSSAMPPIRSRAVQHPWLPAALATMVPGVLLARRFDGRGIVSRPALRQLWEEHSSGRRDHSHRLWSLLMLEFWFREFIDGDAADEPIEYAVLRAA